MPLNSTMIAVALPEISVDLGRDPSTVTQALVTSYLVAAVVLQSPGGKLGDRIGHARMLAVGQALVAAGAFLGFVATSLPLLTAARLLMAAGGAVLVPATVALLRHALPPERRGRAFGLFGAVMALAAAMGPVVGGELVEVFAWPVLFAANLPVLLVSALLTLSAGPAPAGPGGVRPRFDWVGTGLLAAALTSVVLGLRPDGGHAVVLLVVGTALFLQFAVWEGRAADPVLAFSLFRTVPFAAGTVLVAVQNLVMYALVFQVPLVTAALFDLDARDTGRLLVSLMLAMVVTSPVAGRLADRFGARWVAVAGSVAALLAVLALARLELATAGELVVPLALLGVGLGLATPAAQSASISAAPAEHAGMAAGAASTMRYLGGIAGVAVMSLLLNADGTRTQVLSDHRTLMVVFAGALLVGLACAVLLPGRIRTTTGRRPRGQPAGVVVRRFRS